MQKSNFVVEYSLQTTKWQEDAINKRLNIITNIYNSIIRIYNKIFNELYKDKEYKEINDELFSNERRKEIKKRIKDLTLEFGKDGINKNEEYITLKEELDNLKNIVSVTRKNELYFNRNQILLKYHLNQYDIYNIFGQPMYKHFKSSGQTGKNGITSNLIQKLCNENIWSAVNKKIKNEKIQLSYKNKNDINSICGGRIDNKKENKIYYQTIKFDINNCIVTFGNIEMKVLINHNKQYDIDAISPPNDIKFGTIVRKKIRGKYRYYLQLTIEGYVPEKKNRTLGTGKVGLDIGTQTLAITSDTHVEMIELCDRVSFMEKELRLHQRKLDRSRRINNPHFYNEKGEIIKKFSNDNKQILLDKGLIFITKSGKINRKWKHSNNYFKTKNQISEIKRKQSAVRRLQHNELSNKVLKLGDEVYIEKMCWSGLSKRSKETTINKNGKFNRKSRFGKSIGHRAPATFTTLLENKLKILGGSYVEINTKECAASQYNHFSEEKIKKPLSKRWNYFIDNNGNKCKVQRDLYSSFLIQHVNKDLKTYDNKKLHKDFKNWLILHNKEIEILKTKQNLSSIGI